MDGNRWRRLGIILALCLILSACAPPKHYYIQQRQTLLFGSDAAIYYGCVRGVIRWQHDRTGQWAEYSLVQAVCTDVQRSFQKDMRDSKYGTT